MYKKTDDENKILSEVDIVEFISNYVDLKKAGSNFKGYSPFKEENTPSFIVSPTKKIFTCFSTNISGDLIHFYKTLKNITRTKAITDIAKMYNITLSKKFNINKENEIYYEILNEASSFFESNLKNNLEAQKYLEDRNQNYLELRKFKIGYSNDSWDNLTKYLLNKYEVKKLLELGLITQTNNGNYVDMFRNRIMFPIFNVEGNIVGFGGRNIAKDDNPKYINSIESKIYDKSKELYGIFDSGFKIKNEKYAILVEGFLDVISLHKNGFETAVASLGTAFTEKQAKLLKKYTNSIILIYDSDEAGINASKNVINILNKYEFNIRCLEMPKGIKDPDEYFRKHNSDDFLELIKEAKESFEYILEKETIGINISLASSKKEIIERLKKYFFNLKNQIEYNINLEKLSNFIGIDKEILKNNLKRNIQLDQKEEYVVDIENKFKENDNSELEFITLKFLISNNGIEKNIYNLLTKLDFVSEKYTELNKKLKSIDYKIENNDLEYTEEEYKNIIDLTLSENNIINDFTYINLIKDWLISVYIKRIEKNISNLDIKERLVIKNELSIIKDKIKKENNILNIDDLFKKIKILEGVYNGDK